MKVLSRERRHKRITRKMQGTEERPRLVIFRTKKHIYAQLINDDTRKVIAAISSLTKQFKEKNIKSSDKNGAKEVGKIVAEKALNLGVKKVCFDRAGYKYHGRVKALADGVREGGVEF